MNEKISTVLLVLKQPLYSLIAIVTSIGLGLLYYYSSISLVQISDAVEALGPAYLVASFSLTFIVAILAGVNVSLAVFKIRGSSLNNHRFVQDIQRVNQNNKLVTNLKINYL